MSDALMWSSVTGVPQADMNWAAPTREPNSDLDRNAFLRLLITQLQHQDPLNPMDDRDFIAQMAQFSALEQMMQLNQAFERNQAFSMIGRSIDASFFCTVREEWTDVEGQVVTAVTMQGDNVFLTVLGEDGRPMDVPVESVRQVSEDLLLAQQLHDIFNQVQGQRANDLIGRFVQAIVTNGEDGFEFVEGRVDSVKLDARTGRAILVVGNREVFMNEVHAVSDRMTLLGSTAFTNGGGTPVVGVDITTNNRIYLVFGNGSRTYIQRLNYATDPLTYIGPPAHPISFANVSGMAESITIRAGVPFINVVQANGERGQIDFLAYLADRMGVERDDSPDEDGGGA